MIFCCGAVSALRGRAERQLGVSLTYTGEYNDLRNFGVTVIVQLGHFGDI